MIGRHEPKLTAHLHDLPATLMHKAMVEVTKQDQVGKVGWTASGPGDYVMWG